MAVDEVDAEGEVAIVDVKTVRTLVHCPITPLRRLLGSDLSALVKDVTLAILHVVKLHVSLVVGGDGHVVLGLDMGQQLVADEEEGLVTNGALVVALLRDLRIAIVLHVVLHPAGVGLIQMRSKIAVVETPLTDLANSLTLVLVVIAEEAVLVDFSDVKIGSKVPVHLDLGEVSVAVVPHTDLVPGQVTRQSASGEHEDGLADEAAVVGVLHLSRLSVDKPVVCHVHPMLLEMEEPEVVLLNVLVADLAFDLDNVRVILELNRIRNK